MTTLILLPGLASDAAQWRDQSAALTVHADLSCYVSDTHGRHTSLPEMAAILS